MSEEEDRVERLRAKMKAWVEEHALRRVFGESFQSLPPESRALFEGLLNDFRSIVTARRTAIETLLDRWRKMPEESYRGDLGLESFCTSVRMIRDEADWYSRLKWIPDCDEYWSYSGSLMHLWAGTVHVARFLGLTDTPFAKANTLERMRFDPRVPGTIHDMLANDLAIRRWFDGIEEYLPKLRSGLGKARVITISKFIAGVQSLISKLERAQFARGFRRAAKLEAPRYAAPAGCGAHSRYLLDRLIELSKRQNLDVPAFVVGKLIELAEADVPPAWPKARGTTKGTSKRSKKRSKR